MAAFAEMAHDKAELCHVPGKRFDHTPGHGYMLVVQSDVGVKALSDHVLRKTRLLLRLHQVLMELAVGRMQQAQDQQQIYLPLQVQLLEQLIIESW